MKILLATETYPPDTNGAAISVERLAKGLAKNGHKVTVIAPSDEFKDKEEQVQKNLTVLRIQSVPVKPLHPYFRVIAKPRLRSKIKKIINKTDPDIIHIHNHFLLGRFCTKIARKKHIPIIGTNHFMPENLLEYLPSRAAKKVIKYMWKDFLKVYNKLDYVTAPSRTAVKMIKDLGLKTPTKVISNGIDLVRFSKRPVSQKFIDRYKVKRGVPTFLFVGRLERDKNIDLILEALSNFPKDVHVFVVGKGRDEKMFQKLAIKLGVEDKVTFTGRISDEDLQNFYSLADVYIGSGTAELQGMAVMEAMGNSLPVLAVDAVALPELVTNGVNGYLFKRDVKDLTEKMQQILSDKEKLKEMGQQSLKLIQKHRKGKIIEEFEELYEEVIDPIS